MKRKKKGTTLVELVAVMAIMGVVGTIIYSLFGGSNKIYNKTFSESVLQDEMRSLTTSLEDDIRVGYSKNAEIKSATPSKVIFKPVAPAVTTNFEVDFNAISPGRNAKVVYAAQREDKLIAYVLYDSVSTTGKSELIEYYCERTGVTKFLDHSDNIKTFNLTSASVGVSTVVKLDVVLSGKGGYELSYKSTVNPRN